MMAQSACRIFVKAGELVWYSIFDSQYECRIRQRANLADFTWRGCRDIYHFTKFPDFSLIKTKFPWWLNKYKISRLVAFRITGDKSSTEPSGLQVINLQQFSFSLRINIAGITVTLSIFSFQWQLEVLNYDFTSKFKIPLTQNRIPWPCRIFPWSFPSRCKPWDYRGHDVNNKLVFLKQFFQFQTNLSSYSLAGSASTSTFQQINQAPATNHEMYKFVTHRLQCYNAQISILTTTTKQIPTLIEILLNSFYLNDSNRVSARRKR